MRSFPIFILIFIISGAVNAQKTIIFEWRSSTIEGKSFPRSAMMVPVHFPEDTTTYYLQFDTGAHYSTLYSKRTSKIELEEETIKTSLGEVKFRKNEVMSPSKEKNASIGTLGSDFLAGKIVLIDFKNLQIKFLKSSSIKGFALVPMKLLEGRPCLNINLDKKIETVLYDTGSSLFGLWTNKRDWQKIRDTSDPPETFPISSWGKINTGYSSAIAPTANLSFGNCSIEENLQVWYVDTRKFKRFFRRNDLFGILGNQGFEKQIILLDFVNLKFGIFEGC